MNFLDSHREGVTILHGDSRAMLATLPDQSVQTVITSPPYFGLRSYGTNPQVWGGDRDCEHEWVTNRYYREGGGGASSKQAFSEPGADNAARLKEARWREDDTCLRCGAWRGEYGAEPTVELYVEHTVEIFREVRRVLDDTGTLWLNLGDSYNSGAQFNHGRSGGKQAYTEAITDGEWPGHRPMVVGLKPKDLMGMPWRVAFALQADGWYLRSDIIWQKPNCMPEPVRDRPTKAHEYVFLLTKQPRYFYDAEAVKEPNSDDMQKRAAKGHTRGGRGKLDASRNDHDSLRGEHTKAITATGRNRRTVWTVATKSFRGAHFAVMPEALVEPCINAGTSEKGQCPACAAPWKRQVKRTSMVIARTDRGERMGEFGRTQASGTMVSPPTSETIGWEPTCDCDAGDPVPQVVLDPFFGSGTVGVVAQRLGRSCIGIELNAEYIDLARQRIEADAGQDGNRVFVPSGTYHADRFPHLEEAKRTLVEQA